jgi:cysteine synthase A
MQGWVPDFIPKLTEDAVDGHLFDHILPIRGNDAIYYAKALAQQEGIFTGISAGATFAGALEVARQAPDGANILCMLPDTGERYQSTPLFEGIDVEMNEEEIEISRSTPTCRFDAPTPAPAPTAPKPEPVAAPMDREAENFLEQTLNDPENPVVMFALEWCEFCWSVRRMFTKCGIPYVSVDLDSAAYQENDWGGRIRRALNARTDCATIPQIFVGGQFIGGCTELFDAYKDGKLQAMLKQAGVPFDEDLDVDPYDFLPGWLHSRKSAA